VGEYLVFIHCDRGNDFFQSAVIRGGRDDNGIIVCCFQHGMHLRFSFHGTTTYVRAQTGRQFGLRVLPFSNRLPNPRGVTFRDAPYQISQQKTRRGENSKAAQVERRGRRGDVAENILTFNDNRDREMLLRRRRRRRRCILCPLIRRTWVYLFDVKTAEKTRV
jgi:hypothetical protein